MSTLLTPDEVADRLRVSIRTVYGWLRAGLLPGKKFGGVWRIDERDLDTIPHYGPTGPHDR